MKLNAKAIAFVALFTLPMTGASIDIYVPSLPNIHQYFSTTTALVQLSLTVYLIGFGIFQLFVGAVTDSIGRKKPLLAGLFAYLVVSVLITFSPSMTVFLLLRFLQGMAVACIGVTGVAMIPDLFEGKHYLRYMNYSNLAWALSPVLAPYVGGYLQHMWGWHAPFYFLSVYGLIGLLLGFVLVKETLATPSVFHPKAILESYWRIVSDLRFLACLGCLAIVYGSVVVFSVIGPFLVQVTMGYSAVVFGKLALVVGLCIFLGNLTNRWLQRFNRQSISLIVGESLMLLSALALLGLAVFHHLTLMSLMLPVFVFEYGGGVVFPTFFARGIDLFPNASGAASAVLGSAFVSGAALLTALASLFKTHSAIPLGLWFVVFALLCALMSALVVLKGRIFHNN